MFPVIDQRLCIRCATCIFVCGRWIFFYNTKLDKINMKNPKNCAGCFVCQELCPAGAIDIRMLKEKSNLSGRS